ncbi:MAG: hypothetical protein JXQ29_10360, partial [Planctomycetes bacterium]|nr:hypothetical protein [Planctomycetota bacterium]
MSRSGVLLASLVIFLAAPLAARPAPAQPTPRPDLGPGEAVEETDAIFPGAESLDEEGEPRIWAVRIVDARTGLAIPKAVVQVPNHVRRGAAPEDIYYRHVARADRDGWVRVPCKQLEGWRDYIVADAPGYAAEEQCCPDDTECALVAGADVPVVLVDYTGRPVAGARIALNLGCGHIPDQREAATDAAGRAVLRSIYPPRHDDIWVDAPGQHRGTTRLAGTWRPGSPPVLIHTSPGIVVAGRLLLPDGKPWTGALVGPHGFHRPWARTDHEGRFRLAGVSAWSVIEVYATDDEEEPCAQFHAPPEGVERVLVRGAPTSGAPLQVRL